MLNKNFHCLLVASCAFLPFFACGHSSSPAMLAISCTEYNDNDKDSREIKKPEIVELGESSSQRPLQKTVIFQNPFPQPVTFQVFRVSCECVSVKSVPLTIQGLSSMSAVVEFDPREDPNFRGALLVTCEGISVDNSVRLNFLVSIKVVD